MAAAIDDLTAAKQDLVSELGQLRGFSGVGIGAGRKPGTYALYVTVSDKAAAKAVPASYSGYEIVVDVIGAVRPM